MAGKRKPGSQCAYNYAVDIDDGTLCRAQSSTPSSVGIASRRSEIGSAIDHLFSRHTYEEVAVFLERLLVPRRHVPGHRFSTRDFVTYLETHAKNKPKRPYECAKYIREGLEAGNLNTTGHPKPAKDYGAFLLGKGFLQVSPTPPVDYTPGIGDIMVFQPPPSEKEQSGHIQAWGGKYWISDFKQTGKSAPWPGPGYKEQNPPHAVYRAS